VLLWWKAQFSMSNSNGLARPSPDMNAHMPAGAAAWCSQFLYLWWFGAIKHELRRTTPHIFCIEARTLNYGPCRAQLFSAASKWLHHEKKSQPPKAQTRSPVSKSLKFSSLNPTQSQGKYFPGGGLVSHLVPSRLDMVRNIIR